MRRQRAGARLWAIQKFLGPAFAFVVGIGAGSGPAFATGSPTAGPTVVVELFTSQSCYSCPPAEAFLGELAARSDVIALEWHVDYWNRLVYGRHGRWADPYSHAAFTERQRRYNQVLRQTNGVYTPQMVVNGRHEMIGSRRAEVEQALAAMTVPLPLSLAITATRQGAFQVSADRRPEAAVPVWLARFMRKRVTEVPNGENAGKTLINHHIVRAFVKIGLLTPQHDRLSVEVALGADEGCVVLAQPEATGPILGAAYCPGADPSSERLSRRPG